MFKSPTANLLAAPVMGAAFVVFLPIAGIALAIAAIIEHASRALAARSS